MAEQTLFGYRLRPHQQQVLAYEGGRMAVSAVPGSGKTLTLALLAARLIVEGRIGDEGEVLVVTVQNSAVDNIAARIRRILVEQRLPPVGYRVCTLHRLAADILRGRRDLAGVDDYFAIVDEAASARMMHLAAETWISQNRALWLSFLPEEEPNESMQKYWRRDTEAIGREVSKLCKHLRLSPAEAEALLPADGPGVAFARLGVALYALYAQYLRTRAGLDFDDLIWRATDALDQDPTFLAHLHDRWPYILEDEAQDSSPLQEAILDRLAGPGGNWVRVGDPNQAINSTFTAADPRFFRAYMRQPGVTRRALLETGRCARPLMAMADALAFWGAQEHPVEAVRALSFEPQRMAPTPPGDPQPNPPDESCHVRIASRPFDEVSQEAQAVAGWAADYVRRNPQDTVAVLCPTNAQG
ncbi:MAG: ATP-dependent helicase, partial [Anaerolineales bacterium]